MWCKQGTIPNQEMTDMRTKKFEKKKKKKEKSRERKIQMLSKCKEILDVIGSISKMQ